MLSRGASRYSPLNWHTLKYASNVSVILAYIILRGSLTRIHLSPGGTLVAISSLCSVIFVVGSFIVYVNSFWLVRINTVCFANLVHMVINIKKNLSFSQLSNTYWCK